MNGKYAILAVDDEPRTLTTFAAQFKDDFTVLTAPSGKEALQTLRNYKVKEIAAVIVDQRMPEMTGFELMLQIKKEFPSIVRVLFTGFSDTKVIEAVINDAGIFKYVHKPYEEEEMRSVLQACVSKFEEDKEVKKSLNQTMKLIEEKTAHALSHYTSWVVHHVNNSLQSVRTYVDLSAPVFGENDESKRKFAELTRNYVARIADILLQLRNIYAHGLERFVKGKVAALLEFEDHALSKMIQEKKIAVKKELADPSLEIVADPMAIQAVIRKLVANAVEASPEGATVEVKAAKHQSDGVEEIMFFVRDYGKGIPPEIKANLFYPFMRMDGGDKFRGLGLSYVQAVIARHGGDIQIDSLPGKGTAVSFSLPIIQPQSEDALMDELARRKLREAK